MVGLDHGIHNVTIVAERIARRVQRPIIRQIDFLFPTLPVVRKPSKFDVINDVLDCQLSRLLYF